MFRRRLIPAFILILLLISVALADSDWECPNCKRKVPEAIGHICPYCGEESHVWNPATCTEPETCSCGEKQGEPLGHAWQDASCTQPKTCSRCGTTEGDPLGHEWQDASCTEPQICLRCGEKQGEPLGHEWKDASCTEPQICSRCGEKQGEPLGHVWQETCTEPQICSRCGEKQDEPLEHAWQDASCTQPKTCSRCGTTEGEPLGHAWQDAKCTQPKTCSRCGATEGEPLGHAWQEASCTEPMRCTRCGITDGKPLGHVWQDASCTEPKKCTQCGITDGEPLGHVWQDASCTQPKTCSRCETTEGAPLGHVWQDAKCTQPKTCSQCGATEGEPLGHEWQDASCTEPMRCIRCGITDGEPLGHKWQEDASHKTITCRTCGKTETIEAPAADSITVPQDTPAVAEDSHTISVKDWHIGDIVTFGSYEQDNKLENGPEPIEWIVLDIQNGKALLLSRYGLDAKPYNMKGKAVTWETCTLREWLNEDFINTAFSGKEQRAIALTDVDNNSATQGVYDTKGGNPTQDYVFLLSYREAFKLYFSDDSERMCTSTDYAVANGAWKSKSYTISGRATGTWWLRSPATKQTRAVRVGGDGARDGANVNEEDKTVRPALWIYLESDI